MKNIIFLSFLNLWSMDNNKGAPSFYKTVEGYINNGWNVILINPQYGQGNTPQINGLTNLTFKPIFYPLCKIKKISFFGRLLHAFQGSYMLYRLGKRELYNLNKKAIIYSYEVNSVRAGERLSNKYGVPFITRFQGTILAPIENNWFNRLRVYPHFQALATSADLTVMTDDGTLGDKVLKNLNNKSGKICFWRNGVDIKIGENPDNLKIVTLKEKYHILPEDKVLITVSRLASWKRVDRAIKAFSEVLNNRSDCKLIIVGDGDEKNNLISLAEKLNIASNVIFTGAVPQDEIKHYMDLADIFLSLYDLSNVGNPLMEAMSCGKPIITLDVGDTSTLITNDINGILLTMEDIKKIPYYINKILDNEIYAKSLGIHAKEYAKEHFWTWKDRINTEIEIVNNLSGKIN